MYFLVGMYFLDFVIRSFTRYFVEKVQCTIIRERYLIKLRIHHSLDGCLLLRHQSVHTSAAETTHACLPT